MAHRTWLNPANTPELGDYKRLGDVKISVPADETVAAPELSAMRFVGIQPTLNAPWKPFSSSRAGRKAVQARSFALGTLLVLTLWAAVRSASAFLKELSSPTPCDVSSQPGRLLVDVTGLRTHWRPFDNGTCPPLPDYLPALQSLVLEDASAVFKRDQRHVPEQLDLVASDPLPPLQSSLATDPLSFLRSARRQPPTAMLIGDSIDDDGLDQLCALFKQKTTISSFAGNARPDPRLVEFLEALDDRSELPIRSKMLRSCELPRADGRGTALRVLSARAGDSQLSNLPLEAIEDLSGGPTRIDVIMLHSAVTDAMGERRPGSSSFTPRQLEQRLVDLRQSVRYLRETLPSARLVMRLSHRPREAKGNSAINLSIHQLRHLQRQVALSEGIAVFDLGRTIEGYQFLEESGHLSINPGGIIYGQNIVHQLRLALESRSSWRRGWLWDS